MTALRRLENESTFAATLRVLRAIARPVSGALALVALATVGLLLAERFGFFHLHILPLVYLMPVLLAATRWGLLAGLAAAIVSAGAADFLFYEPRYSFYMSDPQQLLDLILFLVVALVTGNLAGRLRDEADTSRRHEAEVRELYAFSRRLAGCYTTVDLHAAIEEFIAHHLGRQLMLIDRDADRNGSAWRSTAMPPEVRRQAQEALGAAAWSAKEIVDIATHDVWAVRLLSAEAPEYGVVIVNIGNEADDHLDEARQRIDALLSNVTETLNRLDIIKSIRSARARTEADLLKDLLIGSVSHEMGSPLATILGSASVLVDVPAVRRDQNLSALAQATHEEAQRLSGYVQKVLHATRISAERAHPRLSIVDPTDVINSAAAQREHRLASHRVDIVIGPSLPLIEVDTILIELALSELLENAAKYSPKGSKVTITARGDGDSLVISVSDQGAGLTPSEQSELFRHPFRGGRVASAVGSGLGLWIAHSFVTASGGTLAASSEGEGRGATITMRFPACQVTLADAAGELDD